MGQREILLAELYLDRCYYALVVQDFDTAHQRYHEALARVEPEYHGRLIAKLEHDVKAECEELKQRQQWTQAESILAYLATDLLQGRPLVRQWWADLWMRQGDARRRVHDVEKAKECYYRALEIDPRWYRHWLIAVKLTPWWIWVLALGIVFSLIIMLEVVFQSPDVWKSVLTVWPTPT